MVVGTRPVRRVAGRVPYPRQSGSRSVARMSVAERRAALVEAAIVVMQRDGVARTTTRAIVAEAGMQIGMFHYCFASKDELILQVMRTINERSFQAVREVLGRSTDASELIDLALTAYWTHLEQDPLEHLLTYELTQYAIREGTPQAATGQYDSYVAGLSGFLSALAAAGGVQWRTPVELLARFVLAMIEGLTLQWIVSRDSTMARRLLVELGAHLRRDADLPPRTW